MRAFVAYFSAHVYKFNTYSHTHEAAACAAHKLFLGSFDYSGQPQSSSAQLPLFPSLTLFNLCITFRTVIFSLWFFYFVWAVHFYFHGIILYFYCASSEHFFIKFRFLTVPEIKCYLFVAFGLVAALRYAPISVPINQIVSIPPPPVSVAVPVGGCDPNTRPQKAQKNKRFTHLSMGRPFFCALYSKWAYRVLCV